MDAITIWEPFCSALRLGFKSIETRTHDRFKELEGRRIALHAGKKVEVAALAYIRGRSLEAAKLSVEEWRTEIERNRGCVIATALVEEARWLGPKDTKAALCPCSDGEGRLFGLVLTDVERVDPPVEAVGRQGVWQWEEETQNAERRTQKAKEEKKKGERGDMETKTEGEMREEGAARDYEGLIKQCEDLAVLTETRAWRRIYEKACAIDEAAVEAFRAGGLKAREYEILQTECELLKVLMAEVTEPVKAVQEWRRLSPALLDAWPKTAVWDPDTGRVMVVLAAEDGSKAEAGREKEDEPAADIVDLAGGAKEAPLLVPKEQKKMETAVKNLVGKLVDDAAKGPGSGKKKAPEPEPPAGSLSAKAAKAAAEGKKAKGKREKTKEKEEGAGGDGNGPALGTLSGGPRKKKAAVRAADGKGWDGRAGKMIKKLEEDGDVKRSMKAVGVDADTVRGWWEDKLYRTHWEDAQDAGKKKGWSKERMEWKAEKNLLLESVEILGDGDRAKKACGVDDATFMGMREKGEFWAEWNAALKRGQKEKVFNAFAQELEEDGDVDRALKASGIGTKKVRERRAWDPVWAELMDDLQEKGLKAKGS